MIRVQHGQALAVPNLRDVALDAVGRLDRAFPVVQGASDAAAGFKGPETWGIRARLVDESTLRLEKPATGTDGAASYYVVEATQDEFDVQEIVGQVPANQTQVTVTIPTAIDPARTMLVGTVQLGLADGVSNSHFAFLRWRLVDSTTIEVTRGAASTTGRSGFAIYVVQWAAEQGVQVTHLSQDCSGDLSEPVLVPHGVSGLARARTMLFSSFSHATAGLEQCAVAVGLPDDDHISVQREATTTSYQSDAELQLVQFPIERAVFVQHLEGVFGTNANVADLPGSARWSEDGSVGFLTGTCAGTGQAFPRNRWRMDSLTGTFVRATRGYAGQAGTLNAWIADLSGYQQPNTAPLPSPQTVAPETSEAIGGAVLGVLELPPAAEEISTPSPDSQDAQPIGLSPAALVSEALAAGPRLEVVANGKRFAGWTEARVSRSIESASAGWQIQVSSRESFPIGRGAPVRLEFGGELLSRGYVDAVDVLYSGTEHRVGVRGRDRTADLIDCSVPEVPSEWSLATLLEIVDSIASAYGVPVSAETELGPLFDRFTAQPGETAWAAIERACRLRGVLGVADGTGGLALITPGSRRSDVALVWGVNILSAQYAADDSQRFAEYTVQGQRPSAIDELPGDAAFVEGRAQDAGARAGRRLLLLAEGAVSDLEATERAEWEATVRAARAVQARIQVNGWLERPGGRLWTPGYRVPVSIPPLRMQGDYVIRAVEHTYGASQGYRSLLTLTRPDAYLRQPSLAASPNLDTIWTEVEGVAAEFAASQGGA